jgi:hypothetical protein
MTAANLSPCRRGGGTSLYPAFRFLDFALFRFTGLSSFFARHSGKFPFASGFCVLEKASPHMGHLC